MLDFQNMLHVLLLHKHSCCGGKKIKKKRKNVWFYGSNALTWSVLLVQLRIFPPKTTRVSSRFCYWKLKN